ncbi:alpha/beta hydrolase [uncultured Algibacter sp.]|uniref:alpha/beta hydrolase n=1 Tax=uncultured Algibacter sp. TaxID=298659 RepID=UPI00263379E6|nr:alpha/beta hydrolase [uncultured Algibacter sp.]
MNKYLPKILGSIINFSVYFSPKLAAKLAIDLFSTPRKGKITPEESEYLNSAIQDEVSYEDTLIKTYHWKGKKETILLAHGWESNSFRWKNLIALLQKESYNIVALDAPAHGASGSKYFNALLYSECINLVVKKFNVHTIIGHSVGGMASVFFQHKYQVKSIKRLVLLGAPADFIGIFNRYENIMGYNERVSKALKEYVLKNYNHLPEYFSPSVFSKEITAKGLIIHDKKDRIIPYKDGLKFKMNYENASFIATKGFGHSLKSEPIYQHILDFLNA